MVVDYWSGVLPALSVVVFSLEHGLESFHAVLVLWWALWVDPCVYCLRAFRLMGKVSWSRARLGPVRGLEAARRGGRRQLTPAPGAARSALRAAGGRPGAAQRRDVDQAVGSGWAWPRWGRGHPIVRGGQSCSPPLPSPPGTHISGNGDGTRGHTAGVPTRQRARPPAGRGGSPRQAAADREPEGEDAGPATMARQPQLVPRRRDQGSGERRNEEWARPSSGQKGTLVLPTLCHRHCPRSCPGWSVLASMAHPAGATPVGIAGWC